MVTCWHRWQHGNASSSSSKHTTATATQGTTGSSAVVMGSNTMLTQWAARPAAVMVSCHVLFYLHTSDSVCTNANHICTTATCQHNGQQTRWWCNGQHCDCGDTTHGSNNITAASSALQHNRPQHSRGGTTGVSRAEARWTDALPFFSDACPKQDCCSVEHVLRD